MESTDALAANAYVRPTSLNAALEWRGRGAAIIAGGTDYYPMRAARPLRDRGIDCVLDLSAIADLRAIASDADGYRLGSLVTWSDIAQSNLPPCFDGLKAASREIGGRQIQNRGTIGGNLCNASPAADGVPALLSLQAQIELTNRQGARRLPLSDFIRGPRKTALGADELLTAIIVPRCGANARGGFFKLGSRRYLVISLVMAAAVLETEDGAVTAARVAVGACSPVAVRLPSLEGDLVGCKLDATIGDIVQPKHFTGLAPIDDPRASASYRMEAAPIAVARLLRQLGSAS